MDEQQLREKTSEAAERLEVPGVAVGVYRDGMEHYAFHGVTSIENPLSVDDVTLFQFGSTGKTFTATAVMRLVEQGKVDLDAPVRTYVPELKLKDDDVAQRVTVLQLLNHTAGWAGDLMEATATTPSTGTSPRWPTSSRCRRSAAACPTTTPRCRLPDC